MQNQRPEFLAYLLSAIAIIGIIILTVLDKQVPDVLNILAVATVVGGAAITQTPRPPGGPAIT